MVKGSGIYRIWWRDLQDFPAGFTGFAAGFTGFRSRLKQDSEDEEYFQDFVDKNVEV